MTHSFKVSMIFLALLLALPALADDQQKADKQLHKITAMSNDATGLRVVNLTVAQAVNAKRLDLVQQRRDTGLSYGDMYIAYTLVKNGAKMDDITAQLKAGKKLDQIANEQHLDWKQLAVDAKKLNSTMENNLYKFFTSMAASLERDKADNYDPMFDVQKADTTVSKDELEGAQDTYLLWKGRATQAKGGKLDTSTENAARGARGDPISGGAMGDGSANQGASTSTPPK